MAVQAMLDLQERVDQCLECSVTSTFCSFVDHPTATTARADAAHAPDILYTVLSSGNELGLHVHAPIEELRTGLQDRLIAADAELLTDLGFPRPITYAAGDFVTSSRFVSHLEGAGFKVDCSVYTLEGAMNRFGVQVDYTARPSLRPYHPSRDDLCIEGASSIVELPVSGHLPEFGGWEYEHLSSIGERIRARYETLDEEVDVFQIFWHPFEVVTLNDKDNEALHASGMRSEQGTGRIGINQRVLGPLEEFLLEFGQRPDVEIASAVRAARCWEGHRSRRAA